MCASVYSSRQPTFSETRLQIAFDLSQGAGLQIFAGVNRHRRPASAAFDPHMRAFLPYLYAPKLLENAAQIASSHKLSNMVGTLALTVNRT